MEESILRRKVRWLAHTRGLLELDLWLNPFLKSQSFAMLTDAELNTFKSLLELPDPHLLQVLTYKENLGKETEALVREIRSCLAGA